MPVGELLGLDEDEVAARLGVPAGTEIVVYCHSGSRSSIARADASLAWLQRTQLRGLVARVVAHRASLGGLSSRRVGGDAVAERAAKLVTIARSLRPTPARAPAGAGEATGRLRTTRAPGRAAPRGWNWTPHAPQAPSRNACDAFETRPARRRRPALRRYRRSRRAPRTVSGSTPSTGSAIPAGVSETGRNPDSRTGARRTTPPAACASVCAPRHTPKSGVPSSTQPRSSSYSSAQLSWCLVFLADVHVAAEDQHRVEVSRRPLVLANVPLDELVTSLDDHVAEELRSHEPTVDPPKAHAPRKRTDPGLGLQSPHGHAPHRGLRLRASAA